MGTIIPFIPFPKAFVKYLPKIADRPYSKIEAAFCLMVDYDDQNEVTISGYAKLWQWNKKTVSKFISDHGARIVYLKDTLNYRNQKGLISILKRDLKGTKKGLTMFIDNKDLVTNRDLRGTKKGLKRDQSLVTTIEPKPKPKPKDIYPKSFKKLLEDYPNVDGSESQTFKNWKSTKKVLSEDDIYTACMNSAEKQKQNSKGDPFYFQLSNLLSKRKYQGDLPGLVNWKSEKGKEDDNGSARAERIKKQTQELLNGQ